MALAILQARMSSTRLPGKVLRPLLGQPMILRELDRLSRARSLDGIVVATSEDPSDDILANTLERAGATVRRGPLDDVLARFLRVIDEFRPDTVVRLTGDNALVDPEVIDLIVDEHRTSGADYSSNAVRRTFPRGLDAEAFRADALRELAAENPTPTEREHVTLGLYSRTGRWRVHEVVQEIDRSQLRWTVDYPEDFAFAEAVYDRLHADDPTFGQADVVALLEREPDLTRRETDVADH